MISKNVKRFVLASAVALLLPGAAGAAGFGPVTESFWGRMADPGAFLAQLWQGLTGAWQASGGSIDPNGGATTNGGGSIDPNGGDNPDGGGSVDPNGGTNGAVFCSGECGGSIDPNG